MFGHYTSSGECGDRRRIPRAARDDGDSIGDWRLEGKGGRQDCVEADTSGAEALFLGCAISELKLRPPKGEPKTHPPKPRAGHPALFYWRSQSRVGRQ